MKRGDPSGVGTTATRVLQTRTLGLPDVGGAGPGARLQQQQGASGRSSEGGQPGCAGTVPGSGPQGLPGSGRARSVLPPHLPEASPPQRPPSPRSALPWAPQGAQHPHRRQAPSGAENRHVPHPRRGLNRMEARETNACNSDPLGRPTLWDPTGRPASPQLRAGATHSSGGA